MRFVDDEFLLLSRGGRVSPGTETRVAKALVAEQARREVVARKRKERRAPRPSESLRAKSAGAVTAAVGRTRHRQSRAER